MQVKAKNKLNDDVDRGKTDLEEKAQEALERHKSMRTPAVKAMIEKESINPPNYNNNNNEQIYIMAIQDLCARYELTVSSLLNIITEMNNVKNHYLKMLGQIRQAQQQQQQQGESISSK